MRRIRISTALSAVALIAGIVPLVPGSPAAAGTPDHVVRAGALSPIGPRAYEYTRFYPDTVQVRRGETVRWDFAGFHTVTFLPEDTGSGPNANHAALVRTDELPGKRNFNEDAFLQIGACGRDGQPVCDIDTSSRIFNSGVPIVDAGPYTATIDLPVGRYRYHCAIHPNMHGFVEVVSGTPSNPTAEQVAAQILLDTVQADAVAAAAQPEYVEHPNGRRTYTIKAGASTGPVSILDYLPHQVDLKAGDDVTWVMAPNEYHTVTFPGEAVGGFFTTPGPPIPYGLGGLGVSFSCDVDGRSTGAPGIPFAAPFCPVGNLELPVFPWMTEAQIPPGDAIAGLANSGILAPAAAPEWFRGNPPGSGQRFPSTFRGVFDVPGDFSYACTIHFGQQGLGNTFPPMTGAITVSR